MADNKIRKMDDSTFDELFRAGEMDLIMMDGGQNLTAKQLDKVRDYGRKQSENKLQEMANKVASQPGYQDFMKMPLMSKLGNSFGNNNSTTLQQDTSFTKIGASNKQKDIKKKETQADVMAKMFNLMREQYDYNEKRIKQNQKYQKQLTEQKEKFFKDIVHILTTDEDGKSLNATGKSLKKGKMGRVAKKSKIGGSLKFGIKAAAVVGGLFVAKDALANIDWEKALGVIDFKNLDLGDIQSKLGFGPDTKVTGEVKNAKEAVDFFIQKGWTPEQSAGIVGNLQAESGKDLNIKAIGDNGKAFGVAQWHPDRQANFKKEFGKDIRDSSLKEQLEFVNLELNTTESNAGKQLRGAKTAGEAATIVDKSYERSSGQHTDKRISNANTLLADNKNTGTAELNQLGSSDITSPYGERTLGGKKQFHQGIDIKGKVGDPVVSSSAGKVIAVGDSGDYGTRVVVDHGDGIKTLYGHLSNTNVKEGDMISKGQMIGSVGTTGRVTGPHLHYEVFKDDKKIDPSSMKALYVNPVVPDFKLASNKPTENSQNQIFANITNKISAPTMYTNYSNNPYDTKLSPALAASFERGYNSVR